MPPSGLHHSTYRIQNNSAFQVMKAAVGTENAHPEETAHVKALGDRATHNRQHSTVQYSTAERSTATSGQRQRSQHHAQNGQRRAYSILKTLQQATWSFGSPYIAQPNQHILFGLKRSAPASGGSCEAGRRAPPRTSSSHGPHIAARALFGKEGTETRPRGFAEPNEW